MRITDNGTAKGNVGFDAANEVFAERPIHAVERELAGLAEGYDFRNHTVVVRGDGVAAVNMGVDSHAVAAR